MSKAKVALYLFLSFLGGVFVASFFVVSFEARAGAGLLAVIVIAVIGRNGIKKTDARVLLAAVCVLVFVFGIVHFQTYNRSTIQNFADSELRASVFGYIVDEPQRLADKQRITVRPTEFDGANVQGDILVTADRFPEYRYGDAVSLSGELQLPKNFDGFDYRAYLAKSGIYAVMYYPEIENRGTHCAGEISLECTKRALFRNIFSFKAKFQSVIERSVPEPNASYINGILLGTRSGFEDDVDDAFRRTGTTHILAISGWNITIIGLLLSSLLMFVMRRQTAFWFTVTGIALFTVLTGAEASVVRAAVMGTLVLIAHSQGRMYGSANAIVFAGFVMALANPMVLRFDAGFQLSFLATLGLLYFSPLIKQYFEWLPKFFELRENVVMTLSAQAFVLPLILFSFNQFSVVSPLVNVLVLPLTPLAMLAGFATGVAGMLFPFLGQIFGSFAWLITAYQLAVIDIFARLPFASISVSVHWTLFIAFYTAIFYGVFRLYKKTRF